MSTEREWTNVSVNCCWHILCYFDVNFVFCIFLTVINCIIIFVKLYQYLQSVVLQSYCSQTVVAVWLLYVVWHVWDGAECTVWSLSIPPSQEDLCHCSHQCHWVSTRTPPRLQCESSQHAVRSRQTVGDIQQGWGMQGVTDPGTSWKKNHGCCFFTLHTHFGFYIHYLSILQVYLKHVILLE